MDIIRFFAAYMVVLDHFSSFGWAAPTARARGADAAFPFLHTMGHIGPVGVEIFFLLSGFVIVASVKGVSAGQFLVNRAIRVLPALWICGAIALVARAGAGEPWPILISSFARSAVLSPAGPHIDGVVWTLIVETVFYGLVSLVMLTNGRIRFEQMAIVMGCASTLFICLLFAAKVAASVDPSLLRLADALERFPFKVFLLRHGVFFAAGMLVWAIVELGRTRRRMLWLAFFFMFATFEVALDRESVATALAVVGVWWLGAAATGVSIAYAPWIQRRTERWHRLFGAMGRFSYPLYLNHYTLGQVIVPLLWAVHATRSFAFLGALLVISVTSYLVMRFPERQLQRVMRSNCSVFLVPVLSKRPANSL